MRGLSPFWGVLVFSLLLAGLSTGSEWTPNPGLFLPVQKSIAAITPAPRSDLADLSPREVSQAGSTLVLNAGPLPDLAPVRTLRESSLWVEGACPGKRCL